MNPSKLFTPSIFMVLNMKHYCWKLYSSKPCGPLPEFSYPFTFASVLKLAPSEEALPISLALCHVQKQTRHVTCKFAPLYPHCDKLNQLHRPYAKLLPSPPSVLWKIRSHVWVAETSPRLFATDGRPKLFSEIVGFDHSITKDAANVAGYVNFLVSLPAALTDGFMSPGLTGMNGGSFFSSSPGVFRETRTVNKLPSVSRSKSDVGRFGFRDPAFTFFR
ncbi:hypothetical protein T10_9140 [Trichinella papuae]|uniref:Uncharacterized protein n=1 Tax=Trichinella papuae TaxID=268474 RepID=A0A0V1N1I3_9BILA|nr:hypothetical protein T10_9140 [Trichinella papuae]